MHVLQGPTSRNQADRADEHLRRWRYAYLRWAGLEHEPAVTASGDLRWDLNALLELVGRGCPPALALRIIDPVEPDAVEGEEAPRA